MLVGNDAARDVSGYCSLRFGQQLLPTVSQPRTARLIIIVFISATE